MSAEWPEFPLKPVTPVLAHALLAPDPGILAEITAGLTTGDDLDALLQRFLVPIMEMAGATAGAVRVLSPDGERLQMISAVGLPEHVVCAERAVEPGCGSCGSALTQDGIVWTSDVRHCARHSDDSYFGETCQRLLAVPMTHRGQVLGLYNLFFAGDVSVADQTTALFKTIGELLGLALHNARLERANLQAALVGERQAMAAELHDSIAQTLAFAKMRMPLLQGAILAHDDTKALQYCADVRSAVSSAHTNLRAILSQFRAPMDPQGLKHALQSSILSFQQLTQVDLRFEDHAPELHLSAGQESQVFRIVQEALANIAKHASAQHAWLKIEQHPDRIDIVVEDDGVGLPGVPQDQMPSHFGLDIMRQRAERLCGTLDIGARAGGGTRVKLSFSAQPRAAA
jgi:two-component system, NarL family, nitrate/nitrite sensor histidine kinase NarX